MALQLVIIFLVVGCAAVDEYNFEDYSSSTVSATTLQSVDIESSPESNVFADRLRLLIGSAPNYAGHYVVAGFGCGTSCQIVTIVDIDTGKVSMPTTSSEGACYSKASRLLIVNPFIADSYGDSLPASAYTYYYLMDDNGLELLDKTKEPFSGVCEFGQ